MRIKTGLRRKGEENDNPLQSDLTQLADLLFIYRAYLTLHREWYKGECKAR
ncbi:MAG: hypothetical protein ACP5PP_05030 [Fervidobacterium sp.]